jgi:predicted  nucleic acid-binding Zn-ribbon protein
MRKRRKKNTLPDAKDQRIAELEQQLAQALDTIQKLQQQVERLQAEVEELKRAGKRQATPFVRRHWVERPKRPGRKRGQGKFAHRELPKVHQIQETKVAKLHGCPDCGGKLCEIHKHEQYVTDIPVVEVQTTCFVTYSGYCGVCRKRVRSHHPEQTSQATGAAGVMVGPRAKALAADLKHRLGVSYGKVSEVLNDTFGLQVCRSGWCQADQKLASTARAVYEELVELIRQCSVVHADETGWRIGTLAAWLWVFTNQEVSVYAIRDNRSSDVIVDLLGEKFQGILASDCYLAYDEKRLTTWLKQKCVGHLLRELKEMKESKSGRALHFARQVTAILQEALALKIEKTRLDPFTFFQRLQTLESRLDVLIAPQRRLSDRDNARFAKRLRKHRPHLLRFLYVDGLEATNNQAERMLRPAVITRKTNGCNRTRGGAATHAILVSVLVTCRQHSIPILDYLVQLQQYGGKPIPLVSAIPRQLDLPVFER